ncbi:MAG: carboxypeptidase-like regulatory domain-containing protein, partial [Flammeovirgaceae bacterium]
MRFIFLASTILSFYTKNIDAQKLDITLLDSTTNEPVSYAHISILNNKTGTYSNEKGQFAVNLDGLPLKIEISHLSYNRKIIDIDKSSSTIIFYLTPSVTMLPEISVSNVSTAGVLRKVWEKNNAQIESSYSGKSFYRQISITDDSLFTEVHEVFYDLLFTNQGITKWKLNQGRFAKQHYFKTTKGKEEKVVGERNFSSLSKIAKMFYTGPRGPLFPIGKNVELLFEVEVTDIFTKEGDSF